MHQAVTGAVLGTLVLATLGSSLPAQPAEAPAVVAGSYLAHRVHILGAPQIVRFCDPVVARLDVRVRVAEYKQLTEADSIIVGGDCKRADRVSAYRRGRGTLQVVGVVVEEGVIRISLRVHTGGVFWEEEGIMAESKTYPGKYFLGQVVLKGFGSSD